MDLVQDFSPRDFTCQPVKWHGVPCQKNGKVTNLRLQVTSKMNDVTIK